MSPVSKYLEANDSQLKNHIQKCYINVLEGDQTLKVVDWSKTLLFEYFLNNQADLDFEKDEQLVLGSWDSHYYTQRDIEGLLNRFRQSFTELAHQNIFGPIYMRGLLTLKFLFNEQAMEHSKFQKIRELYGEVSLENTLKLLIRCQILFSSRLDLLKLFKTLDLLEIQTQSVREIIQNVSLKEDKGGNAQKSKLMNEVTQIQKTCDQICDIQSSIYFNQKYKQLRGKLLYFKGQKINDSIQQEVEKINLGIKECFASDSGSEKLKLTFQNWLEQKYYENDQNIELQSPQSKNQSRSLSEVSFRKRSRTVGNKSAERSDRYQKADFYKNQNEKMVTDSTVEKIQEGDLEPTDSQKDAFDEEALQNPPPLKINNLTSDQVNRLLELGMLTEGQANEALEKIKSSEKRQNLVPQNALRSRSKKRPNKSVQSKRPVVYDGIMPAQRKKINTSTYAKAWDGIQEVKNLPQWQQAQLKMKYTAFGLQTGSPPQRNITTAGEGQNPRLNSRQMPILNKDGPRLKTSHVGKRVTRIQERDFATQSNTLSGPFSQGKNNVRTDASSNARRPGTQGGGTFLDRLQSRGSSRVTGSDRRQLATMSPKQTQGPLEFEQVDEESLKGLRQSQDQHSSRSDGQNQKELDEKKIEIDLQISKAIASPKNESSQSKVVSKSDLKQDTSKPSQLKPILREKLGTQSVAKPKKPVHVPHLFEVKENAKVTSFKIQPRAQTVFKRQDPHALALKDGRRNGFFNSNLNPIVDRERSSKINENNQLKKGLTLEACLKEINRRQRYFPVEPEEKVETKDQKKLSIRDNIKSLSEKKKAGPKDSNSYESPSFLEKSIQADPPIAMKIQNLQTKLKNLGVNVNLPGTQRGPVSRAKMGSIEPIFKTHAPFASTQAHNTARNHLGSETGATDSIMKSVRSHQQSNGQYVPPYGGHTKASLIKQEISNYENSARDHDQSLTQRDIQDLKDMKESSMQGRENLQARIIDYGIKNLPRASIPQKTASPFMIAPLRPQARKSNRRNSNENQEDQLGENSKFLMGDSIMSEVPLHPPSSLNQSPLYTMREVIKEIDPTFGAIKDPFKETEIQQDKQSLIHSKYQPPAYVNSNAKKISAVDSLYHGNGRTANFTAKFSNVWGEKEYQMYQDTRLQTPAQPMDIVAKPSPQAQLLNLERQFQRMERIKDKEVKEKMRSFYAENYGIEPSSQDFFFMKPGQLRDKLIKKSKIAQITGAAVRIQRWFRSRCTRMNLLNSLKRYAKAIVTIQRFCVFWKEQIKNPKTRAAKQRKGSALIQKFLRGYQVRRKYMYELMHLRTSLMYEPFRIIDIIARGHFQRRVRRAWLAYKERKAEKKRKRLARLKKNKGKKKKKKKKAAATLPPGTSINMLDGVTNINLTQTGGEGEAPEEENEDEEEGDDLERADGEEGEQGEEGPKLTSEQAEKLQKDFEERYPDQEGLVTRLDLTALLQELDEEFTEEIVEQFLKAAEEDEETQMITFDDFLKAVTIKEPEDGDNDDPDRIEEKPNESDKDSKQIPETQFLEQSPRASEAAQNFPPPNIASSTPLQNSAQKVGERRLDDDQILAQKRTLSQPTIAPEEHKKNLNEMTKSNTVNSDLQMQPIVDEVLLNLEVNIDQKATQKAIEDRSNSPKLIQSPSDKKQSKTSLKLKIVDAIREEAVEETHRDSKKESQALETSLQSPLKQQNSFDGANQGSQNELIADNLQTKLESSPTMEDQIDRSLIDKEAQKLSSWKDSSTVNIEKVSQIIKDEPCQQPPFSSGSSNAQLAENFIEGVFSKLDQQIQNDDEQTVVKDLNQDSESDLGLFNNNQAEEKPRQVESVEPAFGVHRLKRISRHLSKDLSDSAKQGTKSQQQSKVLNLIPFDDENQEY